MPLLVLLRHGQSRWNLENRFTGWVDVDLSPQGEAEARRGGQLIRSAELEFDCAFTSVLTRAIRTCNIALEQAGQLWIPVEKDWRLNERHYGGLTGLDKAETAARHGDEQVKIWRRSYDVPPPPLPADSQWDFAKDRRYLHAAVPDAESLKLTLERVMPYWSETIAPRLAADDKVLVAAHGNSLRAIVKHLYDISDAEIPGLEIPTGNPLEIVLDDHLAPLGARYLDEGRAEKLPLPK
jgi:2,3-bisphosphoglycerate-dependent phosphoglycerate mutase